MKPFKGHKNNNPLKFHFEYEECDGYKNWRWTEFDKAIIENLIDDEKHKIIAVHIDQPFQANRKSFKANWHFLFGKQNSYAISLDRRRDKTSFFSKILGDDIMYASVLPNKKLVSFLKTHDVGCFWNIFVLKESFRTQDFIDSLDRTYIDNDQKASSNPFIVAAIYRDYVRNSLSIALNDEESAYKIDQICIDMDIPVFDRTITNIFDTSYLDDNENSASKFEC